MTVSGSMWDGRTHTNDPELLKRLYFDACIRVDERRIMCDEKDAIIARLSRRIRELEPAASIADLFAAEPPA